MIHEMLFKYAVVRYSDKGKGRVIVLLHGFLESLEIFNELSDELSKSFRVVCIDLPGHGGSECIGYVHTMEMMADCVKAVLDHLNLRKYVIAGHSMGGYVGLAFAEKYPDNLAGLCLLHSTAWGDTPEKKKDREKAIEVVKKNHLKYSRTFVKKLYAPANRRLLREEIAFQKKIASRTGKQAIIAALEGMKERVNRELVLRFAPFPVLFIAGKKDAVIPWDTIVQQSERPQRSRLVLLKEAGHMGFIEEKKETLKQLRRFAQRCFRGKF